VNSAHARNASWLAARRSCSATLTSGRGWCSRQRHAAASCTASKRPFLTWLLIDRRARADLESLLAKPGGVNLGQWWIIAHATAA
jgi:hypothetical protein